MRAIDLHTHSDKSLLLFYRTEAEMLAFLRLPLSMEEAVHKMTGAVADRLGMTDRGRQTGSRPGRVLLRSRLS